MTTQNCCNQKTNVIACNGAVQEGSCGSCRAVETILPVSSHECVYFTNIPGGWVQEILPFFCPWNSPGKNTGVGCHSLLQGMDLPDPGIEPGSPELQVDSLPSEPSEKPLCISHGKSNVFYLQDFSVPYCCVTNHPQT